MKKRFLSILLFIIFVLFIIFILKNNKDKHRLDIKSLIENDTIHLDKKIKYANLYLESAIQRKETNEMVQVYFFLGDFFQSTYNYQKSLEYFRKILNHVEDLNSENVKSDVYYKIGCNYLELGEYVKAYEFAMHSFSIEKNDKQSKRYAETLNLLGNIFEKTGLYTKSLETHYKSLEVQKAKNNHKGIANSYHNIAHLNMLAERYNIAYNYYTNALNIYENLYSNSKDSLNVRKNLIKVYLSIGYYYDTKNDSNEANSYFLKALDLSNRNNDKSNNALTLSYIANVYFNNNNLTRAREYYMKSLVIDIEEQNKIGIVVNKINLGKIYYLKNNITDAIQTFNSGLDIAVEINAKKQIAEASSLLFSLYSEIPDSVDQAKKYATLYLKYQKYLPNEVIKDSILQLSVKYEVTSKKNEELSWEKSKMKIRTMLFIGLFFITIAGITFIYYLNRIKQRSLYEKKLSEQKFIRIKEVLSATEQERKRIAIDLHDSLGQILTITKMNLSGLEGMIENQDENKQKLYNDVIDLLDQSCSELRNISFNIMPASLIKYGLKSAIEEIIYKINDTYKIEVNFDSKGFEKPFNETLEIAIYRIIQEILNNILKHANATVVNIYLDKEPYSITLSVRDNGKGMEDIELYKNKGLGWKNIFSRVEMLEGSIDVNSKVNGGTKIVMVFPA